MVRSNCVSLLKQQDFMKNSQYPHIVYVEKRTTFDVPKMDFLATTKELKTINDMEGSSLIITFHLLLLFLLSFLFHWI